jgi:hypothetical protein
MPWAAAKEKGQKQPHGTAMHTSGKSQIRCARNARFLRAIHSRCRSQKPAAAPYGFVAQPISETLAASVAQRQPNFSKLQFFAGQILNFKQS